MNYGLFVWLFLNFQIEKALLCNWFLMNYIKRLLYCFVLNKSSLFNLIFLINLLIWLIPFIVKKWNIKTQLIIDYLHIFTHLSNLCSSFNSSFASWGVLCIFLRTDLFFREIWISSFGLEIRRNTICDN